MSIQKINEYYKKVEDIKRFSGTNKESSIRRCFAELLSFYADKKKLLLVDEYQIKGTRKIADGGLIDKNRFLYGYWEAKDTKDDLEKEIQSKIKIGYPTFNIIFENSETAVLFQNEVREQCDIKDPKALDKLLTKLINYESQEAKDFKDALTQFGNDVPDIIKILEKMMAEMVIKEQNSINEEQIYNEEFVSKRKDFLELCKVCINPQINYADIDEMIIQHILTEDIFKNVFADAQFHEENNIAQSLIAIEKTFFVGDFKRNITYKMKSYYEVIKSHATSLESHKEKQNFLKNLYEEFYKAYNPKSADKLGIVYTPSEVVNFMLKATDFLLEKHFDKNLIDKNVHILDPATGTGTFITDLLDYLPHNDSKKFIHKYKHEIHANEVAILPYYIAYLNIEYTFLNKMQTAMSFDNLCWVDTLDNVEALKYKGKQGGMFGNLVENTKRIKAQNEQKISVIIGNPPYNANQQNENDNNKNREYTTLDKRIKDTFVKESTAQKTKVYDMYARFYRWAMDRIDKNGIIAFITNRSFIESKTFDGFRKIVQREFDEIYIIDLKGDVRQSNYAEQGGNVFDIMTGVAIAFFIKNDKLQNENAKIQYYNVGNGDTGKAKLEILQMLEIGNISFERIRPDKKANWLNLSESNFQELIPVCSKDKTEQTIFEFSCLGVATNRDEWVFDFDKENLENKMKFFIEKYNTFLAKNDSSWNTSIKWSRDLKKKFEQKKKIQFDNTLIKKVNYRPFVQQYWYGEKILNDILTQNHYNMFGKDLDKENKVISFSSIPGRRDFSVLYSNKISEICYGNGLDATYNLPLYRYENGERKENITDWALDLFKNQYKDKKIKKIDIFHYVYAVLHKPEYRKKYEIDLKRDFPRIPLYKDFWQYAAAGEKLMDLHLNYESLSINKNIKINRLPLESLLPKRKNTGSDIFGKKEGELENEKLLKKIKPDLKLKSKDGIIEIDELTTISNIPAEVWEYKLGNRSAVDWVLDQYKPYKSGDETIQAQFNEYDFFEYKEDVIKLLLQVIFVSVETMKIVKGL